MRKPCQASWCFQNVLKGMDLQHIETCLKQSHRLTAQDFIAISAESRRGGIHCQGLCSQHARRLGGRHWHASSLEAIVEWSMLLPKSLKYIQNLRKKTSWLLNLQCWDVGVSGEDLLKLVRLPVHPGKRCQQANRRKIAGLPGKTSLGSCNGC